ncbi:amine sulfotransferase-like [Erpetoichthys calabaricus]|uniref:Sulfotransferase n=1 Tax=Erpetoichthys calabaricus TaxID=27687 RepID=A0A8C4RPT8_ERPCA|nr:amine sulfotransferase-like [Erpetoichthys calabaricus]XP_028653661.1 amine sulfotransferase-like [Erpetoichthys calabaricus]
MTEIVQMPDFHLIDHKGYKIITNIHSPEELEKLEEGEVYDDDLFIVTYPKSGTIWMQQIMTLIDAKGNATQSKLTSDHFPWVELPEFAKNFASRPSPRLYCSHLPWYLLPKGLRQKKGKIIYVSRNPKDVLVSYYHFHIFANMLETPKDFEDFLDKFIEGRVNGGSWFDHIRGWYSHKDEFNILFLTYEELIKDLKTAIVKITRFWGKDLDDQQVNNVVYHSTFRNMKTNPKANYESIPSSMLDQEKGSFMRKGVIGDWKNVLTVAQNERFDQLFKEKMSDCPLKFVWNM